ncbi:MAG: hypothetical protein V4689_11165 [Verrucomicrobiota bacterium]
MSEIERRDFIKKKSHIWRAFGRYLSKMSYGKCWYSESPDPQSFFDVDHYRPKLEAKRSETEVDSPGYEWLAFSWDNFRYAANCSNRVSTNDDTGVVEGKGSWFPLLDGSPKAEWANRCCGDEKPCLLDPVIQSDVKLIEVAADGRIEASRFAIGSSKHRVTRSCELYGLNLPRIKEARLRLIREINDLLEVVMKMITAAENPVMNTAAADLLPLDAQLDIIRAKTKPESPYSRAARAALIREGWGELCVTPEEVTPIGQSLSPQTAI